MIDGPTILQGIRFIDLLNKDISRLLTAVDEEMQAVEYPPLWSECYFKSSAVAGKPIAWVPRVFVRVYLPEGDIWETHSNFAFFSVYLTPKYHDEPLALWGIGRRKTGEKPWGPFWESGLLQREGPDFLRKKKVEPFETNRQFSEVLETLRLAVNPLIELNSEDQLERLVMGPIRKELALLSDSGTESPGPTPKRDRPPNTKAATA
jgi:hypothetical protein